MKTTNSRYTEEKRKEVAHTQSLTHTQMHASKVAPSQTT